jgi:hypothetical protein
MFDLMSFVVGASSGLLLGVFGASTRVGHIKEENERLNSELQVLTKRDSKGRFTGGK